MTDGADEEEKGTETLLVQRGARAWLGYARDLVRQMSPEERRELVRELTGPGPALVQREAWEMDGHVVEARLTSDPDDWSDVVLDNRLIVGRFGYHEAARFFAEEFASALCGAGGMPADAAAAFASSALRNFAGRRDRPRPRRVQ